MSCFPPASEQQNWMLYALQWHWIEKERARRAEPIEVGHIWHPVLMWVSKQQEDTRIVGQVEAALGHGLFDVVVVKPNTHKSSAVPLRQRSSLSPHENGHVPRQDVDGHGR